MDPCLSSSPVIEGPLGWSSTTGVSSLSPLPTGTTPRWLDLAWLCYCKTGWGTTTALARTHRLGRGVTTAGQSPAHPHPAWGHHGGQTGDRESSPSAPPYQRCSWQTPGCRVFKNLPLSPRRVINSYPCLQVDFFLNVSPLGLRVLSKHRQRTPGSLPPCSLAGPAIILYHLCPSRSFFFF